MMKQKDAVRFVRLAYDFGAADIWMNMARESYEIALKRFTQNRNKLFGPNLTDEQYNEKLKECKEMIFGKKAEDGNIS